MPHIETARGTFYVADYRQNEATPMLFVHGAGGSFMDWHPTLRRAEDFNGMALDLAGHGLSALPSRQTIRDYADDVVALLDALALPQVILVGHSMGGAIAQTVASQYPKRVAKLILIGTGARLKVNPTIIEGIIHDTDNTVQLVTKWSWVKGTPEAMLAAATKALLKTPPAVTQGDYRACDAFDGTHRLADIQAPTLIMCGTADKMTPLTLSEELRRGIARSTLVVIENGGHMVGLEQPEVVLAHIRKWLLG